jgi:amino acid transporter
LSLAEICSAYPTTGGLYFWVSRLATADWVHWLVGLQVGVTGLVYVVSLYIKWYIKKSHNPNPN